MKKTNDYRADELFLTVRKIFPVDQEQLITIDENESVEIALKLMFDNNFSQLPVVSKNRVVGVFSYKSLAKNVLLVGESVTSSTPETPCKQTIENLCKQTVESFMETSLDFVNLQCKLNDILLELGDRDAVLIGSSSKPMGIVTTFDAMQQLYDHASPFFMLRSIELCLRKLISEMLPNENLIGTAALCLKGIYGDETPKKTSDMTLSDLIQIVDYSGISEDVKKIFGGSKQARRAQLNHIPKIRNDIMHFKCGITLEEYSSLQRCLRWLHLRIEQHLGHLKDSQYAR